jgi:hypothetical protein
MKQTLVYLAPEIFVYVFIEAVTIGNDGKHAVGKRQHRQRAPKKTDLRAVPICSS